MEWCPQHAMNAYLNTLHLRKMNGHQEKSPGSSRFDEPKSMEFLSALAAGNGAELIVQITSGGATPLTPALAVAAKQIGGRFVCIIPHDHHDKEDIKRSSTIYQLIKDYDHLKDVIHFVAGKPSEIIKQYKKIDFIVIDSKSVDHLKLLKTADVNPKGFLIVLTNFSNGRKRESFREILEARNGVLYREPLPVGEGIELTKIVPSGKYDRRRSTRFHVTHED